MLDLIYQGNESTAWQYFDLVWPAGKPGKAKFLADFKSNLAESWYRTNGINDEGNFKNWQRAIEKALRDLKAN